MPNPEMALFSNLEEVKENFKNFQEVTIEGIFSPGYLPHPLSQIFMTLEHQPVNIIGFAPNNPLTPFIFVEIPKRFQDKMQSHNMEGKILTVNPSNFYQGTEILQSLGVL